MTHQEAIAALAKNTDRYKRQVISFEVWSREVDRILELRFPGEPFRHYSPRRLPVDVSPALSAS